MREGAVIFIVSHLVISAACVIVVTVLTAAMMHRPHSVFIATVIWLLAKMATHISYVLAIFKVIGPATVVAVVSINAAASVVSAIYIAVVIMEWLRGPSIREMKSTNDALAKTVGALTDGHK